MLGFRVQFRAWGSRFPGLSGLTKDWTRKSTLVHLLGLGFRVHFVRVGFRIQGLAMELECGLGSRVLGRGFWGGGRHLQVSFLKTSPSEPITRRSISPFYPPMLFSCRIKDFHMQQISGNSVPQILDTKT